MRPVGEVASRFGRRAVALAGSRHAAAGVFVASFAVWWLEAVAVPLVPGRDFGTYLGAYIELFQSHPIDLGYVLGRTPISSLVVGGTLDVGNRGLAELLVALLYASSVTAWFAAARSFGARAALIVAVVIVCYPGYAILFHEFSSDALFAAAFAGWSLLVVRVLLAPTPMRLALVGAGVGILGLVRPTNQILIALSLVALLLRVPWRIRALSVVAFVAPAVALLGGWVIHNGVRYDAYTLARGGNATVPFYRTFVTDRIVRPSNGPESRALAAAVRTDLLPKEPYRSRGISLGEFFSNPSPRMQVDLLTISDRRRGWHTNYRWLRDVGMEAVRAQPATYARGVAGSAWGLLTNGLFRPLGSSAASAKRDTDDSLRSSAAIARESPSKPNDEEPIPSPREGGPTSPDGSIYTIWTSPSEHHLVFAHPGEKARYDALHRRMTELASKLPRRDGESTLALRLNQASRWYPPPVFWLALCVVGLAVRRPRSTIAASTPALGALAIIVVSALGLPSEPHYSVPVAPAFVLFAAAALFERRRRAAGGHDQLG